jgi:hypothetical protein
MLVAWTSAIRCFNLVPLTSSSTSRYRKMPSRVTSCPFWRVLANLERFLQVCVNEHYDCGASRLNERVRLNELISHSL